MTGERLTRTFELMTAIARELTGPTDMVARGGIRLRLRALDAVDNGAVAAIDPRDGSIVGVARYIRNSTGEADIAVEVADDLQGRGIGTALVREIVSRAGQRGITALTGTTLWGNFAARVLAARIGFRV